MGTTDTTLYTNISGGETGFSTSPAGFVQVARDGGVAAAFNRLSSDGDIMQFRKDGTTVGSIGTTSSDLYIGTGDTTLRFADGVDGVIPTGTNGAQRDGAVNLGAASNRFQHLYLSGGVYLGGTGSSNYLSSYEVGTWTPVVSATSSAPSSISYSERTGFYTKIGNLVTLQCELRISSKSGGSGGATITGIPFACKGVDIVPVGSMEASFINLSTGYSMFAVMTYQSQSAIFLRQYGDSVAESSISIGSVGSSSRIRFTITYQTQ